MAERGKKMVLVVHIDLDSCTIEVTHITKQVEKVLTDFFCETENTYVKIYPIISGRIRLKSTRLKVRKLLLHFDSHARFSDHMYD